MNSENEEENKGHVVEIEEGCNYGLVPQDCAHFNCEEKFHDQILDWKIKLIRVVIADEKILGCQFIYKNRTNNEEVTALEIKTDLKGDEQEYRFSEMEDIVLLRVWLKEDTTRLLGFEIQTSKGETKKFGYGDKEEQLIKIKDLENKDKVIVGFGCCGSPAEGMTSIYCYFMSKKDYNLELYSGIFYFRHLIQDETKKSEIEAKLSKADEKHKTLFRICQLPDNHFFGVIKYGLS